MQITRAADYGVRVMVHMASLPPGSRVQKCTLVELSEAPESFLSKVLQRLVAQGLITSWRGGGGGFELAKAPEQVSVLTVVEAIDGPIHLNLCMPGASDCVHSLACAVHPVWVDAREALTRVLGRATMDRLARKRRNAKNTAAAGLQTVEVVAEAMHPDTKSDTGDGSLP